jgi:hypothetical protein
MKTGDRVRKRPASSPGTIRKMDASWATIDWDDGPAPRIRPTMCHIKELQLLESQDGL